MDETKTRYLNLYGEYALINQPGHWYTTTCDNELFFVCKKVSGNWVLIKENKTWQEAKQKCEMDHTGLVTIHSEADKTHIHAVLNYSLACTGLCRAPLNDNWRWVNNEPVTFSSLSAW